MNQKFELRFVQYGHEPNHVSRGVFAKETIFPGETIATWTRFQIYGAKSAMALPNDPPFYVRNHGIQVAENFWVDSDTIGRFLNHSCEPNCHFENALTVVSTRIINPDEECTFDYAMCEDSDWGFDCQCNSPECRGFIGSYSLLSSDIRRKYRGIISPWLEEKYKEIHD